MSTIDFKEKIHSRIDSIDDQEFLSTIYDILENRLPLPKDLLSNESFLQSIEKGMDDVKNGRVISLEQSNKEIDEWLNP
ncbi:MAG: hypothetical protein IPI46_07690 [Bacteroidetes bacterium]|nr:hypothetical protein [Bacteroidota bacterium]